MSTILEILEIKNLKNIIIYCKRNVSKCQSEKQNGGQTHDHEIHLFYSSIFYPLGKREGDFFHSCGPG